MKLQNRSCLLQTSPNATQLLSTHAAIQITIEFFIKCLKPAQSEQLKVKYLKEE